MIKNPLIRRNFEHVENERKKIHKGVLKDKNFKEQPFARI